MSEEDKEKKDIEETESSSESKEKINNGEYTSKEVDCLVNEGHQNAAVGTNPMVPVESEVDATDSIKIEELPNDSSISDNKSSSSAETMEYSNIIYEFPDDSEPSEDMNCFSKPKKRPSDDKLESPSKKSRISPVGRSGGLKGEKSPDKKSRSIENNKIVHSSSSSDIVNEMNSMHQNCKYIFDIGYDDNKEISWSGMFEHPKPSGCYTKHKGDLKNGSDSESDGSLADVEDNADSSNTAINIVNELPASKSDDSISMHDITDYIDITEMEFLGDENSSKGYNSRSSNISSDNVPSTSFSPKNSVFENGPEIDPFLPSTSKEHGAQEDSSPPMNPLKIKSDVTRQKKRQCLVCKKKLGLTAITCRCGGLFCAQHRYANEHSCSYDYKTPGREEIRKNNPKVVADRVKKI